MTSNIVDFKHLEQLANHQNDIELKLVPKINVNDFKKPNHFDKMKVSKSKNIISTDVSASLKYLVENEGYHSSYNTTAWFIKQVAKWFTLMASRNPTIALSKFNNLIKYSKTLQFLRDFMNLFKTIKIGTKGTWKPCQTGVLLSTQSVLDLHDLFLNKKNYKFLLTARFSQDCLENLSSCLKSIQPIPNALQFQMNLKLVCIAQYLKNSSNTNYDQDDREFLGDLLDFSKFKKIPNSLHDEELQLSEDFDSPEVILGNTEHNCLYNIAGTYNY